MIARELEIDCQRCRGTGIVSPLKGARFLAVTMVCSCPAGRGIAVHVGIEVRENRRLYG